MIHTVDSQQMIDISSLSIRGDIVDNYAKLNYTLEYDNSGSSSDVSAKQIIKAPNGMFLSNITIELGNVVYFGVVKEISQAEQEYTDAVESNKSAVIVKSSGDGYYYEINIKAGDKLLLSFLFEGFITRYQGTYLIDLIELSEAPVVDFELDITITSSLAAFNSVKLRGIGPATINTLTDGYRFTYSKDNLLLSNPILIEYTLNEFAKSGKLLTYSNGTDDFFLFLLAPQLDETEKQAPKEYIFVIDVSGSMGSNNRIGKAKSAFSTIIKNLNIDDRFNVISFETSINTLWTSTKEATTDNVNAALSFVDELIASGGTNLNDGIIKGLGNFNDEFKAARALTILSDGEPTEGITDTSAIRANIIKNNNLEASIFSIAFGSGTDESLLASIAYDNGGEFRLISDDDNAIDVLLNFYSEFSIPVASSFTISYDNLIEVNPDQSQLRGPIFNGSEIIQTGRYDNSIKITTNVAYATYNDTQSFESLEPGNTKSHIEKIWAINKIRTLTEQVSVNGRTDIIYNTILDLALYYQLVIPNYTAIILIVEVNNDNSISYLTTQGETQKLTNGIEEVIGEDVSIVYFPMFVVLVLLPITNIIIDRRRYA